MRAKNTALILIGYQNDYFAEDGILREVVDESSRVTGVLENTVALLKEMGDMLVISTPIIFTKDYSELREPVGILKTIMEVGAFKRGEKGSETVPEIKQFGDSIIEIPGKQGLNAFINTDLEKTLREHKIEEVLLAGTVCSICIDSTGRSAVERGFNVTILSDCISGRTVFEQVFYCDEVFPLYATVTDSKSVVRELTMEAEAI
ncbi:MAG: cysteine hydrolase [Flavobacteriales bacterium]|nr:cysteine hydrolase [Flavobacteriales bacterium]